MAVVVNPYQHLKSAQQRIGSYLTGLEEQMGPGPQELAARQAMEQAMAQQRGAVAGMSGQQAAIANMRMAQQAPVMAGAQAQAAAQARAADEQARQQAMAQALGLNLQAEQAIAMQELQRRQQEEARRQALVGGLFNLGATALGGPIGGAIAGKLLS